MRLALGIATTVISWLFGAAFALGAVYGIFVDDIDIVGIIILAMIGIAFLTGGLAAGRKIRYVGEDLDDEDEAYLRGLDAGRRK